MIMVTDVIRLLLFPALMAFAASSDLLTMTISNWLSLALAGGFFLLIPVTGMGLHGVGMHLAAATVVLVVAFLFFSQGWIGGGDAKLAAATALWFGFDHLLDYLIYASLFGGAYSGDPSVPQNSTPGHTRAPRLDSSPARNRRRHTLRRCTRGGRSRYIS